MDTTTIVALAIWNVLLLSALVAVVTWRKRLLRWITGADGYRRRRDQSDASDDDAWSAFLAEHPELGSGGFGDDSRPAADRAVDLPGRLFRGRESRP